MINGTSNVLSEDLGKKSFDFYEKYLEGTKERENLEKINMLVMLIFCLQKSEKFLSKFANRDMRKKKEDRLCMW